MTRDQNTPYGFIFNANGSFAFEWTGNDVFDIGATGERFLVGHIEELEVQFHDGSTILLTPAL